MRSSTPTIRERVVLPPARGPWTGRLYELLGLDALDAGYAEAVGQSDPLDDHDLQMALYLCYELHYAGIEGVPDAMEWSPIVLMYRAGLEETFEAALRELLGDDTPRRAERVGDELRRLVSEDDAPPLSRFVQARATREQVLEHVVHRSAYQLKEADPHSWAMPRLTGPAKAALVEVQADEYGGGRPERIHSVLFANTMRALGLDARYGAYLAHLPGITLATVNLMSWFGLHRRWRGAIVGHLAAFEMTSSNPNRRYGDGFRRLGYGPEVTEFYDEHVEADAVHESIALWDLADGLARTQPELADDIVFGARALLALEARWATHLMSSWERETSSLLEPLPAQLVGAGSR
jgi:hypothetical protein